MNRLNKTLNTLLIISILVLGIGIGIRIPTAIEKAIKQISQWKSDEGQVVRFYDTPCIVVPLGEEAKEIMENPDKELQIDVYTYENLENR